MILGLVVVQVLSGRVGSSSGHLVLALFLGSVHSEVFRRRGVPACSTDAPSCVPENLDEVVRSKVTSG